MRNEISIKNGSQYMWIVDTQYYNKQCKAYNKNIHIYIHGQK